MIYVPDLTKYKCFVINSESVLRAYEEKPRTNTNVSYRDYYIRSSYLYKDGTQQFSQYATLPVCLSPEVLTDNFYYRLDFDKILIIFFIIVFFTYFIMSRFVRVFFLGFKRM